jgi:hypothetical protein
MPADALLMTIAVVTVSSPSQRYWPGSTVKRDPASSNRLKQPSGIEAPVKREAWRRHRLGILYSQLCIAPIALTHPMAAPSGRLAPPISLHLSKNAYVVSG